MSLLTSFAPKVGATSMSVTGGTASSLIGLSSDFTKLSTALAGSLSVKDRTVIKFSSTDAKVNSNGPNGYSQSRTATQFVRPKILANAALTYNTINIQTSFDVETTDAEKLELLLLAAQSMVDSATRDFHLRGAIA